MKPPAFQFYADDFLAGVADMTQAEVGAYILLLCHQWGRGEIPGDAARASLIAKGKVSPHVMSKFPDGKNVRLEKERQKQAEYRQKQSDKGKASAQARFNRGSTNPPPPPPPNDQPEGNSPSPSPSPVITKDVGKNVPEKGSAKASPTSDVEWLKTLEGDPAYVGIPVDIEYAKMFRWCQTNNKQPTRRRFINWLNRAERPMSSNRSGQGAMLHPELEAAFNNGTDYKP